MELSIRAHSIEITDALRETVERRLGFALDVFGDRIGPVAVYLTDLNGPRKGTDKLCQITAAVRGVGTISIRGMGTTLDDALSNVARRLKYRISESLRQAQRPPSSESVRKAAA